MSLPTRKILPHAPPSWVKPGGFFFLTVCTTQRGTNRLAHAAAATPIVDAAKYYHAAGDWYCALLLLMPDHLHAIAAFAADVEMSRFLRKFKIYTSRQIPGLEWQRDFFDHRLRSDTELELKLDYVRQNPVRAGLAATPETWPWQWAPAK